jgi:Permuted papain-like amidase enzyme, YaeF/YiiX, C92 family
MKHFNVILFIGYALYTSLGSPGIGQSKTFARTVRTSPYEMIKDGQSLVKDGDLIVRLNRDPMSRYIKNFNKHDKSYSHAGIVFLENGYPYVFDIVNGEENPGECIRRDSLSRFTSPRRNSAYGIFRYQLKEDELKRLHEIIQDWINKKIRFDHAFDLRTNDRMYCSEMISKAIAEATGGRIAFERTRFTVTEAGLFAAYCHLPLNYTSELEIIPIDALYTNRYCHAIKSYDFQKQAVNNYSPLTIN